VVRWDVFEPADFEKDHDRFQLYGRTFGGRPLIIVFQLKPGNIVRIITGWPI
jgi:uncharacterized DUF497 family protein